MADDTPVLKLRFIDASDTRMELEVASWLAEGGFSTIALPAAEVSDPSRELVAHSTQRPHPRGDGGGVPAMLRPRRCVDWGHSGVV